MRGDPMGDIEPGIRLAWWCVLSSCAVTAVLIVLGIWKFCEIMGLL